MFFSKNGLTVAFSQFDKHKIITIITIGTIVLQEEMMNNKHGKRKR